MENKSTTVPDGADMPPIDQSEPDGGLDSEIAKIIEQAQSQGLKLTGEGGLLPGMIKQAVEAAMGAEVSDHLGYDRYAVEGRGTGNSRNGHKATKVQTNAGPVKVDRPRVRNGEFDSAVLPNGVRRLNEFDDMVLSLYAKGMTTSISRSI